MRHAARLARFATAAGDRTKSAAINHGSSAAKAVVARRRRLAMRTAVPRWLGIVRGATTPHRGRCSWRKASCLAPPSTACCSGGGRSPRRSPIGRQVTDASHEAAAWRTATRLANRWIGRETVSSTSGAGFSISIG
ncbi:MAG: hypothetical protein ACLTEX_05285 [Eggerthella lenta]